MDIGTIIEDFELADQDGVPRRLSDFTDQGPVAVFFYPAAGTGGCTREACHFRDLAGEFAAAGAAVLGISRDAPGKQQQFAAANGLGFPLLSDTDGTVADLFGVRRRLLARALPVKRSTFVLDTGRAVRFEVASETNMLVHADQALQAVKDLARPRPR